MKSKERMSKTNVIQWDLNEESQGKERRFYLGGLSCQTVDGGCLELYFQEDFEAGFRPSRTECVKDYGGKEAVQIPSIYHP